MTINDTLRLLRSLIPVLFAGALSVSTVLAQSPCEKELVEAEDKLQRGYFDEAVALVNRCLNRVKIGTADSVRCYLLLGKVHYAKSLADSAIVYLRKLLAMIPNWRPDPAKDNPSFKLFAEKVILDFEAERLRQQAEQQKTVQEPKQREPSGGNKKWLWIGGALAAGTAAFLVFRGDGNPPARLPDPPALPGK